MRLVAWGISVINFFFIIYYNNDLKEIQCLYSWVEEELIKMSEIFKLKENGYDVTVHLWKHVGEVAEFIAAATGMLPEAALEAAISQECTVGQVHFFGPTTAHIHVATWMCASSLEVDFVLGHEIGHLFNSSFSSASRNDIEEGKCDAWGARHANLNPRQMARFIRNASQDACEYRSRLKAAIQEIRSW